jgi:hypothetical protein
MRSTPRDGAPFPTPSSRIAARMMQIRGGISRTRRTILRLRGRRTARAEGPPVAVVERPFLEEMAAVEKLLPISPDEINRRVLASSLGAADLDAAERLNGMNLRYFEAVVRPLLDEWRREVRARRAGQAWGFAASCAAIVAGGRAEGAGAYVLLFVGTFGFCTALAAWFGSAAAGFGTRLAEKLLRRGAGGDGGGVDGGGDARRDRTGVA